MTTIASVQVNGVWGPVTPIPQGAMEVVASPAGYTVVAEDDFYSVDTLVTPLNSVTNVFSGTKIVTTNQLGLGLGKHPVVNVPMIESLNPTVVRIHDYGAGTNTWRWYWALLEPTKGNFNWTYLDQCVAHHFALGRKMTITLFGTPAWASARPTENNSYGRLGLAAEPANMQNWSDFCTAIATRYAGRITHYEIWNEPNLTGFFTGTKAALSQMTRLANQAIKAIDPLAKIVSSAVTSLQPTGTGLVYFSDMMMASDGATGVMKDWVDVIGCHLYPTSLSSIKDIAGMISNMRSRMTALGVADKPLWNTEFSILNPVFAALSEQNKKIAIQALLTLSSVNNAGGCDMTIWYNPDNGGDLGFTATDIETWQNHLAQMNAGVTFINILKNGNIAAVINGQRYLW